MTSARQWRGRKGPSMLLLCCVAAAAAAATAAERQQGAGIGDYEYLYDELPREHLARFGRDSEHVQHVPADAPRPRQADDDSVVQRVPRRAATAVEEDAAPEATTAEVRAAEPAGPVWPGRGAAGPAGTSETGPRQGAGAEPEPSTELQPPPRVEGAPEVDQAEQTTQVPAAVPDRLAKEDMETSNFFWGLGPVYPHLYVYRRVPHLVPLHGWNPYHAYVINHPPS